MAKKKILSKAVKGIASLFKGKDVPAEGVAKVENVFAKNLVDEFGVDEVREAYRIIDTADADPQLSKLFYRENESKMDELVNLLEARYMGSERLHAHPLSFNRRGPGAAERYSKLNETGERLTDMPGGPGDRVLYFKNYGEMSKTTNREGQRIYKNEKPTILDEGKKITDEGTLIEGKAIQDSLYDKTITDIPLINRMMKETGKTETEIREAIAELANQGYESGSPKLMSAFDDDSIRAFVSNKQAVPGDKEDFVTDMMEALGEGPRKQMDDLITGMTNESDEILQSMKKMEAEAKAMSEIAMAEQTQLGGALDSFNRMIDAGDDPAEALQFLQDAIKKARTKQADGGRVEMALGGAAKGIMEAIKLAARGVKPFGQKQTYKQKVTTKGVSQEQFDEIFEKQLNRVPDEVYDEPTGKGLHTSLLQAEAILTGQKLGLMTQTQRTKIAKAMRDKVAKQIYDNPVAGLSNDYLEYMDDAVGRMDDIFEIERLGGDLTPKPIFDGKEMIGAQVDFTQLNRLGDKVKDNVIPFKPRDKKSKGGLMSLLKTLGMRAPDKIADKKQIENVIRDPKTDLERILKDNPSTGTKATPKDQPTIDEIRDMIQNDPRYDKLTAAQMDEVVKRETVRADFAYNMGIKPEEVDDQIVDMLMMEGYASRFGFKDGGAAYINKATLESIRDMPIRSRGSRMPYVQKMQSDMEKYMRMGKKEGGVISEAELADPRYNSATGEYEIGGGVKLGKLELDMLARGVEGYDPTMKYEGKLDLGNDFMLQGGYYDDAIMQPGMMSPEDEIRLSLTKSFANGGTVPPQKGPMSQGMGTLYRSK